MIETSRARQAFSDYLALGDGRSLAALAEVYRVRRQQSGKAAVPVTTLRTLERWSAAFGWQARLRVIADQAAADTERELVRRRREIMESGLALDHERTRLLKALVSSVASGFSPWVDDIKLSASGKSFPVQRFNAEQLNGIRALLDDIAKEVGGRQKKSALDITSGGEALKALIGIDTDAI